MKRIFGTRKEKPKAPTLDEATGRLDKRGDVMDAKIAKLEEQLRTHREQIRKCRPGPAQEAAKRRALQVLKQKRMYENQRGQLMNQQFNVEQTSFALQSMQDSVQTVQAMKVAGKELKAAFKQPELNINDIENLQDQMADMMDMHQEIQDVLGQNFGVPDDIDEEELMGELDALEDELANEVSTNASGVPSYLQDQELPDLPSVQHNQPAAAVAEETDEFGLPAVPQRT
jgi:charged multivesicular body protein 5